VAVGSGRSDRRQSLSTVSRRAISDQEAVSSRARARSTYGAAISSDEATTEMPTDNGSGAAILDGGLRRRVGGLVGHPKDNGTDHWAAQNIVAMFPEEKQ
jgi:hypothetical protein